jgi:2,3-dihydroxybenzoate decarboxylase
MTQSTFPSSGAPAPVTGGAQGYLRIATEEAFATPEIVRLWLGLLDDPAFDDPGFRSLWSFYGASTSERARFVLESLQDLGETRIKAMDDAGIDRAVLSLTSPGAQPLEVSVARGQATLANDQLAEACKAHPGRFSGLTAVAPQDPEYSAREIERGHGLGFNGVIINSHTQGEYLDDPKFYPILEAAEALGTPVYLHPNTAPKNFIQPMLEAGLDGAIWGFAVETGTHLLRLITKGVFDRFPNLKMVAGHLGEALPFWMYRLDYMHAATVKSGRYETVKPLELTPSEYLRRNIWITTSGMAWTPAIMFCREVLGADRVMYAMDYPYEYSVDEVRRQDDLPLTVAEKKQFFQLNAESVFHLPS